MTPCPIISQTFLKKVSLEEMKDSYLLEIANLEKKKKGGVDLSESRKILFKAIPKQFP
jgi:hypothetical protein